MWKGNYQLGEVTIQATNCKEYNQTIVDSITNLTDGSCIEWVALKDDKIIEEITKQQEKKLETIAKTIVKRGEAAAKKNIDDAGEIILTAK